MAGKWKPYTVTWERLQCAGKTVPENPQGELYPESGKAYAWAVSEAQAKKRIAIRLSEYYDRALVFVSFDAYEDRVIIPILVAGSKKREVRVPQQTSLGPLQGELFRKAPH